MVHVQPAFAFGHASRQVGPGGHAVLTQCFVQLLVHGGQATPLTLERFLVFRPRLLPKAPIFDALDVGQILEHRMHVGQFVVDGRKIAKHHGRPRHKPIKRQLGLSVVDKVVKTRQDFEGVGRRPRRGILDKARQGIKLGQANRGPERSLEGLSKLRPMARWLGNTTARRCSLRFAVADGPGWPPDFVQKGSSFVKCWRIVGKGGASAPQGKAIRHECPELLAAFGPNGPLHFAPKRGGRRLLPPQAPGQRWASPLAGRSCKAAHARIGVDAVLVQNAEQFVADLVPFFACSW